MSRRFRKLRAKRGIDVRRHCRAFSRPHWGSTTSRGSMCSTALRVYFHNGDVAHVRPSGNAPQLRIYANSGSQARADQIVELAVGNPTASCVSWNEPSRKSRAQSNGAPRVWRRNDFLSWRIRQIMEPKGPGISIGNAAKESLCLPLELWRPF